MQATKSPEQIGIAPAWNSTALSICDAQPSLSRSGQTDPLLRVLRGRSRIEEALRSLPARADTPFQSQAWLSAWNASLGDGEAVMISAQQANGQPLFYLPLQVCNIGPLRLLVSAAPRQGPYGSCWFSPACAQLKARDIKRRLSSGLAEAGLRCDALLLCDVDLARVAPPLPRFAGETRSSYSFTLEGAWTAMYQANYSKKRRAEFARLERKLEREAGAVSFEILGDPIAQETAMRQAIDWKLQALALRNIVPTFACSDVQEFLAGLPAAFAGNEANTLIMARLSAAGRPLAYNMGLHDGATFYGLIMAHDDKGYGKCGPGRILLHNLLEHLCESGLRRVDLGKGEHELKQTWARQRHDTIDIVVPLTPAGLAYAVASALAAPLARRLRKSPLARRAYRAMTRIKAQGTS